jgi:hypothetical protein
MKKKEKMPSLDETYVPDETGLKMNPYDRLQSIFAEKENNVLSESAKNKIDFLLGEQKNANKLDITFDKIKRFLIKIDEFIFRKKSRIMNTEFHSRKKNNDRFR